MVTSTIIFPSGKKQVHPHPPPQVTPPRVLMSLVCGSPAGVRSRAEEKGRRGVLGIFGTCSHMTQDAVCQAPVFKPVSGILSSCKAPIPSLALQCRKNCSGIRAQGLGMLCRARAGWAVLHCSEGSRNIASWVLHAPDLAPTSHAGNILFSAPLHPAGGHRVRAQKRSTTHTLEHTPVRHCGRIPSSED